MMSTKPEDADGQAANEETGVASKSTSECGGSGSSSSDSGTGEDPSDPSVRDYPKPKQQEK